MIEWSIVPQLILILFTVFMLLFKVQLSFPKWLWKCCSMILCLFSASNSKIRFMHLKFGFGCYCLFCNWSLFYVEAWVLACCLPPSPLLKLMENVPPSSVTIYHCLRGKDAKSTDVRCDMLSLAQLMWGKD